MLQINSQTFIVNIFADADFCCNLSRPDQVLNTTFRKIPGHLRHSRGPLKHKCQNRSSRKKITFWLHFSYDLDRKLFIYAPRNLHLHKSFPFNFKLLLALSQSKWKIYVAAIYLFTMQITGKSNLHGKSLYKNFPFTVF